MRGSLTLIFGAGVVFFLDFVFLDFLLLVLAVVFLETLTFSSLANRSRSFAASTSEGNGLPCILATSTFH